MAKKVFSVGDKQYCVDEETGEIYEIVQQKVVHPTAELVAEAIKQISALVQRCG